MKITILQFSSIWKKQNNKICEIVQGGMGKRSCMFLFQYYFVVLFFFRAAAKVSLQDQTDYIVDESMSNLQNDYGNLWQIKNGKQETISGPNSSKRRFRTSFTEQQSQFLEDSFQESHYPDQKAKREMASALKLPEDRITVISDRYILCYLAIGLKMKNVLKSKG